MATGSLVIATCNKARYLNLTLAALTRQTLTDFEIVITDDGSADDTVAVVDSYRDRLSISLIRQKNAGRATARQRAIDAASGDQIIFIDDDIIASPDFVRNHLRLHESKTDLIAAVGLLRSIVSFAMPEEHWSVGDTRRRRITKSDLQNMRLRAPFAFSAEPGTPLIREDDLATHFEETVEQLAFEDPELVYEPQQALNAFGESLEGFHFPWTIGYTGNLSVERQALIDVGGFDPSFVGWGGEDTDLCYRLHQMGVKFRLCPKAIGYHQLHKHSFEPDEAIANLDRFLHKHDDFACYLALRVYFRGMSTKEANDLYTQVIVEGNDLAERELMRLWKMELAMQCASGQI